MRAIRYNGNILTFAGKILRMAEWVYQEGVHYLRVLAGGGVTKDRNLTEDIYRMEEEYSFPTTEVGVLSESGRVERASGIYRFASRLFNLGAGVKYNATQLVTNGNFANGTTGWGLLGVPNTLSITDKIIFNGTATVAAGRYQDVSAPTGNKLYIALISTNAGTTFPNVTSYDFGTTSNSTVTGINNTTSSVIINAKINGIRLYFQQFTGTVYNNVTIDDVRIIDLTATFGAGNEPSKEVCDVIFADYFDGTKEVQLNDVTQATANSQPYLFKKGIKNPNGGDRFMTHPTVSFAANEAWSVSTLIDWDGTSNSDVVFIGVDGTSNSFYLKGSSVNRIQIVFNSGENYVITPNVSTEKYIGKKSLLTFQSDGNQKLTVSINGVILFDSVIIPSLAISFSHLFQARTATRILQGKIYSYFIRSGALTPEQITAEYNLLRSYFPEISTVQVGSKHIATDNCEMVATPKGNVISLNNLAGNVEKITDPLFLLTANQSALTFGAHWRTFTNTSIVNNQLICDGLANGRIDTMIDFTTVVGRVYKKTIKVESGIARALFLTDGSQGFGDTVKNYTAGEYVEYFVCTASGNFGQVLFYNDSGGTNCVISKLSLEEVGFAGAADLYTAIYNQTSGTVAQKTLAALKAAAMWRSPDSDLDKQAVFGKIFNKYAAKLFKVDIDTYNTENPTATWGYHVMTRSEAQALGALDATTLKATGTDLWTTANGTNTTGLDVYGAGVINADGTYSDFKGKARLMTDDDYALDINDDGTSTEIAVTTEGGILRLVKD